VDINVESVEITKLGLWIKTASRNHSLATLDSNIKCGNSLIDDASITKYPFDWKLEFSTIFDKGGFDIIVGNPPYIVIKGGRFLSAFQYSKHEIDYIRKRYLSAQQQINTYTLFVEKSIELMNQKGYLSFIVPNTFLANEYSQKLRELLLSKTQVVDIYNVGAIFEDANIETLILTLNHEMVGQTTVKIHDNETIVHLSEIALLTNDKKFLIHVKDEFLPIIKKMHIHPSLSEFANVWRGITTGDDKKYLTEKQEHILHKKVLSGKEIQRYYYNRSNLFVFYDKNLLDRARDERIFLLKEKLISKFVGNKLSFCFDNEQHYVLNTGCVTELTDETVELKYLLALLNSQLINFYFHVLFTDNRDTFPIMKSGNIEQLPIYIANATTQHELAHKANQLVELYAAQNKIKNGFLELVMSELKLKKMSAKVENWYHWNWEYFSDELSKSKTKIPLKMVNDWKDFFQSEKTAMNALMVQIKRIENEIDNSIFTLYNINDTEQQIVKNFLPVAH